MFIPLLNYCTVSVYLCIVYSIFYLADRLLFHKLSRTEWCCLNILINVNFRNFSLTIIMLFLVLFLGVIFLLPLLCVFICCLYFLFSLCSCAVSVIGLVAVVAAHE